MGVTDTTLPHEKSKVNRQVDADQRLADLSDKDRPWDNHRSNCDQVATIYYQSNDNQLIRYNERMTKCSEWLNFMMTADENGEVKMKLNNAFFCRVRHCPVCQWRRSLMWKARFLTALPEITAAEPSARWIFLTLTQRNCKVSDLKTTLQDMGKAWQRLIKRREFKHVLGWVRTVEVTRGKDGSAHPHYHCLMLVKSTYFKGPNFVSTAQWATAWQEASRFDYTPVVDARAVKARGDGEKSGIESAVAETLKYAVKPSDMKSDPDWFIELTKQLFRTRSIASGGLLKDVFKDEDTQQELINPDEEKEETDDASGTELRATWRREKQYYASKKTN